MAVIEYRAAAPRTTAERPIRIFLNDAPVAVSQGSPYDLAELAVGYLLSEGLIADRERFEHMWLIKKSHVILSAIEMVVLVTMLIIVSAGSFEGAASVYSLVAGQYAPAFWGGIVLLGLVAPFLIEGYPVFIAKRVETSTTSMVVSVIGEAGVLVGGFMLRLLVILAALPVLFL